MRQNTLCKLYLLSQQPSASHAGMNLVTSLRKEKRSRSLPAFPESAAAPYHRPCPHNLLIILLHLIRCLESKKINTCLKHSLGQLQKTDIGFLLRLILFAEDLGLMIKAVECIGNLINICTDFMRSFSSNALSIILPNPLS